MKGTIISKKLPLLVIVSALVLTVAFSQNNSASNRSRIADTVPGKQKKIRDLDEALLELDRGEVDLNKAMREIDGEKLERQLRASMKDMDHDMVKMKEQLARSMKEVDMVKMKAELQKALKEVDVEKIKREVEESVAKIDMEKMKGELEKLKEIDYSKMKSELENIRPQIEKSMVEARKDMEKARIELTSYKNLVNALDKDGLLNKTQNYKLEYRNGELTVNGKKLSAGAAKKYSEFLNDKENFTIQKEDDDFNIHHK